jgi:hypothetical protein
MNAKSKKTTGAEDQSKPTPGPLQGISLGDTVKVKPVKGRDVVDNQGTLITKTKLMQVDDRVYALINDGDLELVK